MYLKIKRISIHYVITRELFYKNKIVIDNIFSFKVTLDITRSDDRNEQKKSPNNVDVEMTGQNKKKQFSRIDATRKAWSIWTCSPNT